MLYTRKGDDGTTGIFGCNQRMSKSSAIAEALGTLDELNSFLGLCKSHTTERSQLLEQNSPDVTSVLHQVQENLFIIQAEMAGAPKFITTDKITQIEKIIDDIEKELGPIKDFSIAGGEKLSAFLDVARTVARRAERRVIAVHDKQEAKMSPETLKYLNRLSSLLFALARIINHQNHIKRQTPNYK